MTLGWSQHRIAADLGVSQPAVSKLLKRVEERLLRELTEALLRHKARQTLQLRHQYAEAIEAWAASKADTTRKRQRKTRGPGADSAGATVAEVVVENRHGDPRFLDVARRALADERKIWGLDAAQHVEVRTSNPYEGMTEDALREELARQDGLLGLTRTLPLIEIAPESTRPGPIAALAAERPAPEGDDDRS